VSTLYVGVDPGAGGGLAALTSYETAGGSRPWEVVSFKSMPDTELKAWSWFNYLPHPHRRYAAVEQVQGYIGNPHPGSAMFNFGRSYGSLRMALVAAGFRFEDDPDPDWNPYQHDTALTVRPQVWQAGIGISSRKRSESKEAFKRRLKVVAEGLFPKLKITLATADALLIAEYLRRLKEEEL
jgi:hypothetical protein